MLTEYELQREQQIAANKRKLEELGLLDVKPPGASEVKPKKTRSRSTAPAERTSTWQFRQRKVVSYREDEVKLPREKRVSVPKAPADVDKLRTEFGTTAKAAPTPRKPVDSGKGVRIQGGRVYDSKYGVTCHWCRQKTLEEHVTCTNDNCGNGKRMPTSFCKMCLRNRHGEDATAASASGKWVCPCCRVSCGTGCSLCCNCGPCRKKAGLGPTFQMVKLAKEAGFDNVHDYLVGEATGLSQEDLKARKLEHDWGQWMAEGEQAEAAADEDTQAEKQEETAKHSDEEEEEEEEEPRAQPLSRKERALQKIGLAAF